jgi:predicted amidophosphoribosyltransferase
MFNFIGSFFKKPKKTQKIKQLICMCQEDTWRWPSNLGTRTEGVCSECGRPIYFEKQNADFSVKICNRCAMSLGK